MRLKTLIALASVLLSSSAPAVAAPPVPRGPEFRIDTNARPGSEPRIAAFPGGGFVVVWTGSVPNARFLDAQGRPEGGVFRLGGVSGDVDQVLADRDGSFLVVWTGWVPSPESSVFVRRFNHDGTPRGKRIRVHLPSPYGRRNAAAALGPDGRFAVAWEADIPIPGSEWSYTNAVGRIFTSQGTPLTPEITLRAGEPPTAAGDDSIDALPSSLALKPDGTLAAVVHDDWDCFANFLVEVPPGGEPSDVKSLGPFCGYPHDRNVSTSTSLAMGRDGSLVAVWSDSILVQAQRFSANGTLRGNWFDVSNDQVFVQFDPTVALQAGGTFVVVWTTEDRDGDGLGIFGRAFAAIGTPRTEDFRINTTTEGNQFGPAIAASRQGPAVVVWSQQLEGRSGIFARVLSPDR